MKRVLIASATAGLFLASSFALGAQMQTSGIYLAGNIGYAKVVEKISGSNKQDNTGVGGDISGGYKFNQYFALDAGASFYPVQDYDYGIRGDNNYAIHAAAKLILPLKNTGIALYTKLGGAAVHHRLINKDKVLTIKAEGNNMKPAFFGAVGIGYAISQNFALHGEFSGTTKNGKDAPGMYIVGGGITYILPNWFLG